MFGQSYIKYEIFPKLNEPQVEENLKQYQLIKPVDNHDEDYFLYSYNMKNTLRLDYLIECMPFIKITFAQLLIIIREFILAAEKFINMGFVPVEIKANNIYLILKDDKYFTYYFQNIKFDIDFIGVKWIQEKPNKQMTLDKYIYNVKDLALQLFIIFKQKYQGQMDDKLLKLLEKFQFESIQNQNVLDFLEKFFSDQKIPYGQQYFSQEFKFLRELYEKFKKQINKGSEFIELQVLEIQKIINTDLDNNYIQTILSSVRAFLYNMLYNLLYQEIGALIIYDKIPEYLEKSNQKLIEFRQLLNFQNSTFVMMFGNLYISYISLQMHFKSYYNLDQNWVENLKQYDIKVINNFFLVAAQQLKFNQYNDVIELLTYDKN
ncbi:hypothetical protein pb186bvf_007929 [Paramecium bursaria]